MLLVLALADRVTDYLKPGVLQFLRTSRSTLLIAFVVALATALETHYAGISQVLFALWLVVSAVCLVLAIIPPRSAEPRGRNLYFRIYSPITWTSAAEEAPYHPPAR